MKEKQKHELFLNRSVELLQGKMKESEKLINDFKNACNNTNDKDKRKVILIDNALYDIVHNLKTLHGFSEFVKTTLVGKNSSYENSLYNMNDYNESNEYYLDLEMSEY